MKNEFQLLDALDEDVLHDEATEEPSYDLYYKNNETGDFGFYGLSTPSKEEAIEAAKECKAEKPHCDYFVMTDIDDCIFSTKSQNKAMEQLGETVKIVPDHKTSLDLLNHDLGEKINPELYKPFGHDSYDSGYIHEPEMPDWYDPEEDEPSMLPPDADDEDYDDDFDFELEEDYKQGGERTFTPDEPEYAKIKAVADKLNSMNLVSKWDHKTPYEFSVEDVYLDYGSRWMWTTIVATLQGGGDSHQVLSPNEWLDIVNGTVPADVMANKMLVDEYAQFEKSKKGELEEAKKVGLVAAAKRALAKACDKLKNGSPEEIYNRALETASRSEYPFVKDNLIAKKDAAIEFIVKRQEAESFDECKTLKESELDTDRYEWIRRKSVEDTDGFLTDYTMWYDNQEDKYIFILGDSDLYGPEDTEPDWESDTREAADEWFDNYGEWADDLDESVSDPLEGYQNTGTVTSGGKIYWTYRKIITDENGNHRGIWKAAPQDLTSSDPAKKYGPDTDKAFDITYQQALGNEPIGEDSGVAKLSRALGKKLLPQGQGLTESARGYALTYNFGDDEYDYSCSWAEALDIIKSELSTQDIIDMIDDPDFDPERHDLDDFILSNLEVFDDLLHDALKSDARAQYELDKDYAREFNSSRRYNEEVDPDEEFDHTVYGFTKMIDQATSKEELDDIAQAVNNMELPQETVDRIVKALYAKTQEVKRSLGEAAEKVYTIVRSQNGRERETSGTLEELIQHFSYTLQNGYSWQGARKGNHKIDRHPKTISALIKNLNWAADNAAANGYSGTSYSLAQEQKECLTERLADIENVDTEHYVVGKKGMWFAKDKSESELLTKAYCSEDEGKTWHVCYLEKKSDAPSGRTQAGKAFFRTPKLSKGRVSIGRNVLTWYANSDEHEVDYSKEIDHVNGNFTDDHLSNLEPVTPSENKKRRKAQKSMQEGFLEIQAQIKDLDPIKTIKRPNGQFLDVYEVDGKYYDANGIEIEDELLHEDILDPYCNDEERRGELPAPEEEKQEALNESLADVLAQIHLGDEIDEKVVGDWEINAWTAPSGYYIVQLDNEKLDKHYHLGDNESQRELEMKLKRLVNSHKELVEKASPDGYAPKQTGKAYKVFRVKNGKLYPPMVANAGGADTPIGVWLDAEEGEFAGVSKTGRPQVKSTGSGTLAYRPGWHLGDVPRAPQFDRRNKETGEMEFPADFVWAECDYAMDINYQDEADERGYMRTKVDSEGNVITTKSDKYQHSLAGLPKLPKDGYYKYRTNPRPDTVPWVITGQMKVNRLLSDAEVNEILQSKGIAPIHRQGGDKTLAELGLHESLSVKEDLAEKQKGLSEGLSRDEMIAELKKLGKGYYKFDTKSDKQLSMILQKELSRPKKHIQTIDVPGAQFCPECHTQLADNGECPKCSGNMTEAFEDEYNNVYVELKDGKPSFAYDQYRDAMRGMAYSKMGDNTWDDMGTHTYEVKYLKDGKYYALDKNGEILEEDLSKDERQALEQELYQLRSEFRLSDKSPEMLAKRDRIRELMKLLDYKGSKPRKTWMDRRPPIVKSK